MNTDCHNNSKDKDEQYKQYKWGSGYCKNGKVAGVGTSIGCSGTCIEKLDAGADCRKSTMNIPFNFPWDAEHEACNSGRCLCGVCTSKSTRKLPNNARCSEPSDCNSNWCSALTNCLGRCENKPKWNPTSEGIREWTKAVDAVEINASVDIPAECRLHSYEVGLYSFANHGSHFFLAATAFDKNKQENGKCPAALAFASLDSLKVTVHVPQEQDLKEGFSVHMLGKASLGKILDVESSVDAVDDSKYDLTKKSCAHYAQSISRGLNFDETPLLANFLIENLLRDDGLVKYAGQTMKQGGLRVLSKYNMTDKGMFDKYVKDTVFSQLNIK